MKKTLLAIASALVSCAAFPAATGGEAPVMAVFVKNNTSLPGMDDCIDSIRDSFAAEASGAGFSVIDAADTASAFNRFKTPAAAGDIFSGASASRLAQMLGADLILVASVNGADSLERIAGDRPVVVYTLRMSLKVLDSSGASVYGKSWSQKRPVAGSVARDSLGYYREMADEWASDAAKQLVSSAGSWLKPRGDAASVVSFTVRTTVDAEIEKLAAAVDASSPVKDELRVVAGGVVVEIDGAAVGSSGGRFFARPGLHSMRVTRQWMEPWSGTVNITEGAVFDVALELSADGMKRYGSKEALRAELARAYSEAAMTRGIKINFDTSAWQGLSTAPAIVPAAVVPAPVRKVK
ncbi:MAG: hypothetical protein IKD42_01635 [Kiritimatiellae bacterium]|nr:hypothetical protein [Kiritimatiellia bacterium]